MKKLLFVLFILITTYVVSQVNYSQNWSATGLNSWTSQNGGFGRTTSGVCATTGSVRANLYSANATGNFASPLLSNNNGGLVTVSYLYKIINYSGGAATPNTFGTLKVQYSAALAGPWTDVPSSTISTNHVPSTSCATKVVQFTPALGNLYIRFNVARSTGDYYIYFDDVTISQGAASTVPTCASLSLPSNGATNRPVTQTITWASTAGATGYDVYFGTSATPPLVSSNQAGTTYNPGTLNANTTYYHKIVPRNSVGPATGCNTWSFTTLNPPSNDNCSGATSLPCGTNALAGTTVNAQSETPPNSSTSGTMGVWYTFVGDGQSTTITVVQSLDTRLLVLTSSTGVCGGTYTTVANVDNTTSTNETTTFTSINGTTYFIYIGHWNSTTATGTFTISRTCVTAPSNNNCSSAPSLTVNSSSTCTSTTNGTTVGATQSSTSCTGTADDDVWYSFVATQTSQIITVTPGTMSDAVFQVYGGTCAGLTSLACIDNTSGSSSETTTVNGLTIGSTYYVRVHSYGNGSGQGTFSICASTPCTTPTTAGTLSVSPSNTGTVNDAFTFTTTGNGGSITKIEWSYDNFATTPIGFTNNPVNPYTLIFNAYQSQAWVRTTSVDGTCPDGITTPILITLQLAPPYVYGTEDGDYISNVTLNTINNNSTCDLPLGDAYQDFTSISTTLVKGSTYNISVSSPVTFLGSASGYAAWIDFDNDGVFEVSENIMQKAPATTQTQSFTVPSGAATALVKMRVLSRWNSTPTTDPYNSSGYNWGEIEEYSINFQDALPVELIYFEGKSYGYRNNLLTWKTATEHECSHFNLLHSEDGETWNVINTVNGSLNSMLPIEYSFKHTGIKPIVNYYKLQQYDINGVYEIFKPILINNINLTEKFVVKYLTLLGQEIDFDQAVAIGVYIEVYNDGSIRKIVR